MSRGKPYHAGLAKGDLKAAIQAELRNYKDNEEFESELISGLIEAKHYYCSKKALRPSKLRKAPRVGGGYDFEGFFTGRGWHMVSWSQCITQRDEFDWLKRALRDAIQPRIIRPYKRTHPTCEICGAAPSEEVDHVAPEFDQMANAAIAQMSLAELNHEFARFDWWSKDPFALEASNSAMIAILQAHEGALLRAVCRPCHRSSAEERRLAR